MLDARRFVERYVPLVDGVGTRTKHPCEMALSGSMNVLLFFLSRRLNRHLSCQILEINRGSVLIEMVNELFYILSLLS